MVRCKAVRASFYCKAFEAAKHGKSQVAITDRYAFISNVIVC